MLSPCARGTSTVVQQQVLARLSCAGTMRAAPRGLSPVDCPPWTADCPVAQPSLPPTVEVQLQILSLCVCVSGYLLLSYLVGLLKVPKTDILAEVHR